MSYFEEYDKTNPLSIENYAQKLMSVYESTQSQDDFIEAVRLLGYHIGMVENEVKDYLRSKDCYIKASLKPTEKIKYSFVDLVTDKIVCSSPCDNTL